MAPAQQLGGEEGNLADVLQAARVETTRAFPVGADADEVSAGLLLTESFYAAAMTSEGAILGLRNSEVDRRSESRCR